MSRSAEEFDEPCHDLKGEVERISEWLRYKKLSFDKRGCVIVGHKKQTNHILMQIEISVNGEPIRRFKKS